MSGEESMSGRNLSLVKLRESLIINNIQKPSLPTYNIDVVLY